LAQLGFLFLVFLAVAGGALGLATLATGRSATARMRTVLDGPTPAGDSPRRWMRRVSQATRPLARLSAPEEGFEQSAVRRRLVHAGIRDANAPATFFGLKTALALACPVVMYAVLAVGQSKASGYGLLAWLLGAAAAGYYLPNAVLSRLAAARQLEIFEAFPDALDLMTVCIEAGLGTEAAMVRVAEEIGRKSQVLSDELRLVNLELRAGAPRERALRNLAVRTGVDEVAGFVSMIVQAERFGTSIAQSLRVHAEMLRTERRQRAEEAAAKIALKLLFPLIFFIFPSLMLVLLGPAMIQIHRVLLPIMTGGHS
jgi:tight adherence protein C